MGPSEGAAKGAVRRPARRRVGELAFVAVMALLMVGAAYFQEEIRYFFQLQAWNAGRAAQTVVRFLKASAQGIQGQAESKVVVNLFHLLMEHVKFTSYQEALTFGNLEYRFSEVVRPGAVRPTHSELVFKGNGAAMVTVPDAKGQPIAYRLEMQGGAWKITEIRGGRLRR